MRGSRSCIGQRRVANNLSRFDHLRLTRIHSTRKIELILLRTVNNTHNICCPAQVYYGCIWVSFFHAMLCSRDRCLTAASSFRTRGVTLSRCGRV